jgi:hypothetical protein
MLKLKSIEPVDAPRLEPVAQGDQEVLVQWMHQDLSLVISLPEFLAWELEKELVC